jgi:glycosyltransferase involved in cell wall biosynthesis
MRLVAHAARHARHVITFSEHSRTDIIRHIDIRPEYITTTLLAAEERYVPAPDSTTPAAEVAARYGITGPFIYYVGGLDVRKNVAVLLHALALLRQQGKSAVTLAIAGHALGDDRHLFPDLDGLIANLGLQETVQRIAVPYEDGPLLYRACTLFAFPSRYEGFGLPPLEAMACGAPVVTSSASSLPEVVGDAALLVAPDDVAGWAAALERLLTDAALRADLRARGLAQAARFSWQRVAEETLQVYEQVANT